MSKAGTKSNQGDDFQVAVAMHWVIKLLSNDNIDYMQAESNGLPDINESVPVDDIVIVYQNGNRTHIQSKKNQTKERAWSIKDWGSELPKILEQLEQGDHITVELYSATPLGDFKTLIDACKEYSDFYHFTEALSADKKKVLDVLVCEWAKNHEEVYNLLKRLQCASPLNLEDRIDQNYKDLGHVISQVDLALPVLESFINRHQSKSLANKLEIRAKDVMEELSQKGLTKVPSLSENEIIKQFNQTSAIGRNDWKRTIAGEKIDRTEFNDILKHIKDKKNTILVLDRPGSGKTCLLLDVADEIEALAEYQLLFIKGDRFAKINSNENALPNEIVEDCGMLSECSQVIVIIDSLDVLSCQRDHKALNYFLKLIDQLELIPNVTIIAACRDFDLKYDPLLRDRKWDVKIELKDFDYNKTVLPILKRLEVDDSQLNAGLQKLLCLPQNLSLFEGLTLYEGIFNVRTTYELYDAFIEYTLKQDPDLDDSVFDKIHSLVSKLLKEREHSVSKVGLNIEEELLQKLISKGVLNQEANRNIGFSHQTLLDNFVASHALKNDISLTQLILKNPPLPFFRPSVRSYIFFLRGQSSKEFRRHVRETLAEEGIAYHFKRLIVETYAEMIPNYYDWSLVRWMFLNQEELFKRFFWILKSVHWFDTIANKWYPSLTNLSNNREWYSLFLRKLDCWMNTFPKETVTIWTNALKTDWGKDNLWSICADLSKFKHYQLEGVEDIIFNLKNENIDSNHWIGEIYCNYIDTTGNGYEILWEWMTRDAIKKHINQTGERRKLHCESHDLRNGRFLEAHLSKSAEFLNLVLNTVLEWIDLSLFIEKDRLTCKILEHTSIPRNGYSASSLSIENISILVSALEKAILHHGKVKTEWWCEKEKWLQKSNEIGFRYILIKAYLGDIENNLDGIATQLCDKKLLESDEINFDLGILLNRSFHLLSEPLQDKIVNEIGNLFSNHRKKEKWFNEWSNRVKYDLYLRIPACFRSDRVQGFLGVYVHHYCYQIPSRKIYSRGGLVTSPVSSMDLDSLGNDSLHRLFTYYRDYRDHSDHPADHNSGGLEMICMTIIGLAKNNPTKYLRIAKNPQFEEFSGTIGKEILEGICSHINCRLGKVNDDGFKPVDPLPDLKEITKDLLTLFEKKNDNSHKDISYVRALSYCVDALSTKEEFARIVNLLIPIVSHEDPDGKTNCIQRQGQKELTPEDINTNAHNSVRGKLALTSIGILNRQLDSEMGTLDSIKNLVMTLANDSTDIVKAGVLWDLHYTAYRDKEIGWKIFNTVFRSSETKLWVLAERFMYHQYYNHFELIKPYLDRIRSEGFNYAGETWARISALCMIKGNVDHITFFEELEEIDKLEVWKGALDVFIANLEESAVGVCQTLFRQCFGKENLMLEYNHQIDRAFDPDEKGRFLNKETGHLYIKNIAIEQEKEPYLDSFFDWIELQAMGDPIKTLEICEHLLKKLQSFKITTRLYHSKPLLSALTAILREADESDDVDLINRVVNLQDQFLQLGVEGMEEYLDDAAVI